MHHYSSSSESTQTRSQRDTRPATSIVVNSDLIQVDITCLTVCLFSFLSLSLSLCCQNELAILEFIHNLVETLDKYFENVCELDVRTHTHTRGRHIRKDAKVASNS